MTTSRSPGADSRPNIIVILADDMGFSDIGCFGSEIRTPNLDRMAKRGLRFSQMYNCARCCPTRASLLTGLYPHQAGVGHMVTDYQLGPAYQGYLRDDCVTIGEVLSANGYRCCYSGKWHASPGIPVIGSPVAEPGSLRNPYPRSRGFEDFYGTLAGCGNFFNPHGLMEQDHIISVEDDQFYYTDAISDKACAMIDRSLATEKPFFMHVCYTAPHWPLHARPEDIEKYRGKYQKGWDYFRTARHEELKGCGVLNQQWEISPRDENSREFHADDPARREWEDLRMAVYAAQVESMDRGIGKILDSLAQHGIEENTIIMFLSDNGGCAEFLNEDGDGRSWPSMYRHSAPPGKTCTVGNIPDIEPGGAETFMSYDLPWANVSNAPFRLYKHWVHEGGISSPFVIQGPGIREPGGIIHQPCHIIDIMASCLEWAQATYPTEFNNKAVSPPAGESFVPLLSGKNFERERPIGWEHEGNRALRHGEWKLVSKFPGKWELYNMEEDRTELHDLAKAKPDKLKELIRQYEIWADNCGVIPWPIAKKR